MKIWQPLAILSALMASKELGATSLRGQSNDTALANPVNTSAPDSLQTTRPIIFGSLRRNSSNRLLATNTSSTSSPQSCAIGYNMAASNLEQYLLTAAHTSDNSDMRQASSFIFEVGNILSKPAVLKFKIKQTISTRGGSARTDDEHYVFLGETTPAMSPNFTVELNQGDTISVMFGQRGVIINHHNIENDVTAQHSIPITDGSNVFKREISIASQGIDTIAYCNPQSSDTAKILPGVFGSLAGVAAVGAAYKKCKQRYNSSQQAKNLLLAHTVDPEKLHAAEKKLDEAKSQQYEQLFKILCCGISLDIVESPHVVQGSGNTYSWNEINAWFNSGKRKEPISGQSLEEGQIKLVPNYAIQGLLEHIASRSEEDDLAIEQCIYLKDEATKQFFENPVIDNNGHTIEAKKDAAGKILPGQVPNRMLKSVIELLQAEVALRPRTSSSKPS